MLMIGHYPLSRRIYGRSPSNIESIERAESYNVSIEFDEQAQAPFYYYTDAEGIAQ